MILYKLAKLSVNLQPASVFMTTLNSSHKFYCYFFTNLRIRIQFNIMELKYYKFYV